MLKKHLINIIAILFFPCIAAGQEVIIGLQSQPLLKNNNFSTNKSSASDTINLPFFDDFSGRGIFPDTKRWVDSSVFINNTYSNRQLTTGIATFDALDSTGSLYESISPAGFEADHLTSQPINLNYPASDNIWLSFYYQPGGLGDLPEENDSLTLHFFSPSDKKWHSVWRVQGNSNQSFKPVTVRIENSRFLKKGFRFRFVNYASVSSNLNDPSMVGNCDHWNIDYVVLDKNRNSTDTIFRDVAFRYPSRSLLKTHEAMPWKQFRQVYLQEMGSSIPIHYRNNDLIVRNVTRNFEIWDVYKKALSKSFTAGATNIDPMTNVDYNASLIYTFNTDNNDSALFRIKSWLITDDFDPKQNDTTIYYQRFSNYFAFDDGTSEGGYGINGLGSRNAMVAFRFKSIIQDTLRAISICFNDSYLNANQRSFDLMVWDDINGLPGNLLYTLEEVMVRPGNAINGFHTYNLSTGIMVNNIFYVGWKQRSETFLNAGIDVNTPHGGKQYYWINGNWNQSQVSGTLMIRPIVGPPLSTGIRDLIYENHNKLNFWPNPASDVINVDRNEFPSNVLIYISIIDLTGRELIKVPLTDKIDISRIHEGIYIIVASRNGIPISTSRLIRKK
jgi:hypothetical protein